MSAICSRPAGIWCAACHSVAPEAQVSGLISRCQGKKIFTSWVSAVISLVPRACLSLNLPTTCDHTLKQQNVWSIIRMFQDSAFTNQTFSIVFRLYLLRSLFTAVGSTIEWYTISPFSGSLRTRLVHKFQLCWANSTSHFEWIDLWTLLVLQGFWARYHTGYVT